MTCVIGCFLGYAGTQMTFFYLACFGQTRGWMSDTLALYLLPILNAASSIGRVVPNWLADRVGALNVVIPGKWYRASCPSASVTLYCIRWSTSRFPRRGHTQLLSSNLVPIVVVPRSLHPPIQSRFRCMFLRYATRSRVFPSQPHANLPHPYPSDMQHHYQG